MQLSTRGDSFFEAVKLNENADLGRYGYIGYGIRFNESSLFS